MFIYYIIMLNGKY